jgi:hypothetical protein
LEGSGRVSKKTLPEDVVSIFEELVKRNPIREVNLLSATNGSEPLWLSW